MGINVIDDTKAQQALLNVENQTVKDVTGQILPVLFNSTQAILDATFLTLQRTLADFVSGLDAVKTETLSSLNGWYLDVDVPPFKGTIKLRSGSK